MNSTLTQILSLYEDSFTSGHPLSPAEIAAEFQLEPAIVESVLKCHSAAFRAGQNLEEDLEIRAKIDAPQDIEDEVADALKQQMITSALQSDNEQLRFRASKFLWEERKGRNHARAFKQPIQQVSLNLIQINEQFRKIQALRQIRQKPTIQVK